MSVDNWLLHPLWGQTFLLLLSVAVAQAPWPSEPPEAVRDWKNQLEASMRSVLSDFQEAVPTVVGIPDGTAVVGRSFRVSIPTDLIASSGEIIKVRLHVKTAKEEFPSSSLVLRLDAFFFFCCILLIYLLRWGWLEHHMCALRLQRSEAVRLTEP